MANIRINIDHATKDGLELVFRAPCDASDVTGLTVHSITADTTQEFKLTDANGNDLGAINHLFAGSAVVKVILDVTQGKAFVQNADTNKYLEDRFIDLENKVGKDGISATHEWNGTVLTVTSASGTSSADLKGEKGDRGEQGPQGVKGDTYNLTDNDKTEIAEQVAEMVAYVQPDTPPDDAPENSLWIDTDEEIYSIMRETWQITYTDGTVEEKDVGIL